MTMMSVAPSRSTSARVTSETPRPTGRVTEDGKRALPVASPPEPLLKKTVRVPSPALRTTRSSQPSPLRSAVTICAGQRPVGSDPIRTKLPSRQAYNETALSVASTLASTGPWFVSTATMSREGWPGLIVMGGSKVPGSCGRPFLQRMSPAPLITITSSAPSPLRSATSGVAWGLIANGPGAANVPLRPSNTDTSLETRWRRPGRCGRRR